MDIKREDFTLKGIHHQRVFLGDVRYVSNGEAKPIVLFIHGFKGFKDWGYFDLMADYCASRGFVFAKINLSHNGTTPEAPLDFADLEAFGQNNYTTELNDIGQAIDYLTGDACVVPVEERDAGVLTLMGHSRGGGISIVKSAEDSRVKKLVTWASVAALTSVIPMDILPQWKQSGVHYIFNSRTKQEMPLYYQIVEDYLANEQRLSVTSAEKRLTIPHLIVHGTEDETVPYQAATTLRNENPKATLVTVEGANHVFGGGHPYPQKKLPDHALEALEKTVEFLSV